MRQYFLELHDDLLAIRCTSLGNVVPANIMLSLLYRMGISEKRYTKQQSLPGGKKIKINNITAARARMMT